MFFIILIILLIITFGCDAYICFVMVRSWPVIAKIAVFLPTLLFFGASALVIRGNWSWALTLMVGLLLCIVFPKMILCLFSILGKGIGLAYRPLSGIICASGLICAVIVSLCGLYGITVGWKHLVVKDVEIKSASLPKAFDGYRIVQISDLHLGTFANDTAHINKMVDRINALEPDLIVFTGDLVNFTYLEVLPFKQSLSRLHAKDGVMSILGNHDYALYAAHAHAQPDTLLERLIQIQRDMGWQMLLDESCPISRGNDTIWIAGVQNIGQKFSANRGNLTKALGSVPPGAFTVLLSHDPTHWEDAVMDHKAPIPLTLSGHTHSMQIRIFGWSPSALIFKHWNGLYQNGDQFLYVSPGTGGNMPFRFGAWPEITKLTLEKDWD